MANKAAHRRYEEWQEEQNKVNVDEAAAEPPMKKAKMDESAAAEPPVKEATLDDSAAAGPPVKEATLDDSAAAEPPVKETKVDETDKEEYVYVEEEELTALDRFTLGGQWNVVIQRKIQTFMF